MSVKLATLNNKLHGKVKIKAFEHYDHVKSEQALPILAHEYSEVAAEMPIVFVKGANSEDFESVALLGFKPGENFFYQQHRWLGNYIPAYIHHYPFALMPSEEDDSKLQVIIYENSDRINETEGEAIFDDQGKETDFLVNCKNMMGDYYEKSLVTRGFIKTLNDMGLLSQQSLNLDFNGEKISIKGIYLVDDKKLNELSDKNFLELRKKHYLAPLYQHMGSLSRLNNLARLKSQMSVD